MEEKDFLENWRWCNKITIEILKNTPNNVYFSKPFKNRFKSFAWEFACLLTTREMYINGFKNNNINKNTKATSNEEAEKFSKEQIIKELEKTNKSIEKIIKDNKIKEIKFFGNKTSKLSCISWLMQHEQLHFGKLMLYCAQLDIKQSNSLKIIWGESSFKK
ncbi:hypothetical protein J4230_05380 [Candidatus Woesearchaeota archaeon]|nr:hypothetical protein [Candidatus Woesearchaeota archaeon]